MLGVGRHRTRELGERETATQANDRPAAKASSTADQVHFSRIAMAPRPASGRHIPSRNHCQPTAKVPPSCGCEDTASSTSPPNDAQRATQAGLPSGRPEIATITAVTPTLDATMAWTRKSGSSCSAITEKTKPSRSTVRPAE